MGRRRGGRLRCELDSFLRRRILGELQNPPVLTITRFVLYSYTRWSSVRIDNPAQFVRNWRTKLWGVNDCQSYTDIRKGDWHSVSRQLRACGTPTLQPCSRSCAKPHHAAPHRASPKQSGQVCSATHWTPRRAEGAGSWRGDSSIRGRTTWREGEGDNGRSTETSVSPPSKTTTSATLKLENQPDCLLYQY